MQPVKQQQGYQPPYGDQQIGQLARLGRIRDLAED